MKIEGKRIWVICKEFAAPATEVTLEIGKKPKINKTKKVPLNINLN